MNKSKKIIDNPTSAELMQQMKALESFESLYKVIPLARQLFPKMESVFSNFSDFKEQAKVLMIPDQFNERFSFAGWIAYESMNLDSMKQAILLYDRDGIESAENYLVNYYNEETLKWGIQWFNGNSEFRRRIRLAELAKEDYLACRYHACIPLLLSMLDGLVNDVSKHVGFFAESSDMTAWDCIAAHETGLQTLATLMTKGRNKTNENSISIPYRNGILHGRELAFDNQIVAAKCWSALFAARDWAVAISDGKKTSKPKEKASWSELIGKIVENDKQKKLLDAWKPRKGTELAHLPYFGSASALPSGSPERAVSEFINNWMLRRYGLLADSLIYFTNTSKGKKAGLAKEDFGKNVPLSFKVVSVEDQSSAASKVIIELEFLSHGNSVRKEISVWTIYQDENNDPMIRDVEKGSWKIQQNSFSDILYENCL